MILYIKVGSTVMTAISSHRAIKMRVLILFVAIFACAAGAPSAPLLTPIAPVAAIPLPTAAVNSGDLQAAIIDAKVQTEDLIRAAADHTRENAEQAIAETNEKVIEANDLARERSLEAFWASEEKKWQALDAVKTAEAQLDGQLASTSDTAAKSLVAAPIVAPIGPVVAPIPQYFYTPGIVAPTVKIAAQSLIPIPEPSKPQEQKEELKAETPEDQKNDAIKIESADFKAAEAKPENISGESKYVVANAPIIAPIPLSNLKIASPWLTSPVALVQPGLNTVAVPYAGHVLTPTVIKTVW
ncbi:hypothetical protein ACJJTC_011102 [Scirpophaga incertulas]